MAVEGVETQPAAQAKRVGAASLLARAGAGIFGGYAFAWVATDFLSRALPMDRSEAVAAATMFSFTIYAAAIVWVFAARRVWLALVVLIAIAACLGLGSHLIGNPEPA